jgi:signal peptidase I
MPSRRLSTWVLAAVLALLSWVFLAPPALGGQTSYVVTRGVSMQPAFHTGDLALVRQRNAYEVGDIIAYRSHTLGITVLHRIVSADAQGFRTQGDNNSWIDPDVLPADEVIGELWVHVPGAGAHLRAGLLVPVALLLGVAAIAFPARARARARGRSHRRRSRRKGHLVRRTPGRSTASAWLTTGSLGALTGVALLLVSVRAPAVPQPVRDTFRTHHLELSYSAPADPEVYQGGRLVTGDPVFLDLNPVVELDAQASVTGEGTATPRVLSLLAHLTGADGLKFDVPLATAAAPSEGDSALHATVDLRAVQETLARAAAHTGYDGAGQQWSLVPTLLPAATDPAADAAGAVEFEPVVFQVAGDRLTLADGDRERGEPIVRTATEPVDVPDDPREPAERLQVLGAVVPARPLQVWGAVLLVLGAALAAVGLVRRRHDPLARLTQPLVTSSGPVPAGAVETGSLGELFELAKRYDRPVLRVRSGDRTVYLVEEAGIWYRSPGTGVAGDEEDRSTAVVSRRTLPPVPSASRPGAGQRGPALELRGVDPGTSSRSRSSTCPEGESPGSCSTAR